MRKELTKEQFRHFTKKSKVEYIKVYLRRPHNDKTVMLWLEVKYMIFIISRTNNSESKPYEEGFRTWNEDCKRYKEDDFKKLLIKDE